MRAWRARRVIWFVNLALGALVLGLGAWYATEVHAQVGRVVDARVPDAVPDAKIAVRRFMQDLRTAGKAVLKPSVSKTEVTATFKQRAWWWPFVGPLPPGPPPPPPPPAPESTGLERYARIAMLVAGDSPQLGLSPTAGGKMVHVAAREPFKLAGTSHVFELLRVTQIARFLYEVAYLVQGEAGESLLEVRTNTAVGATDPVRPDRLPAPAPDPIDPAAPPSAAPGTMDVATIQVKEFGARRVVRMPARTWRALRADAGRAMLEAVKTREVELPGARGIQLTQVPVKASIVNRLKLANGDTLISINGVSTPTRGAAAKVLRGLPEATTQVSVVVDRNGRRLRYEIGVSD